MVMCCGEAVDVVGGGGGGGGDGGGWDGWLRLIGCDDSRRLDVSRGLLMELRLMILLISAEG